MNIYCYECGAANHYSYSSGKPDKCFRCASKFELVASTSFTPSITSTSNTSYKKGFSWTKKLKLEDLITLTVTEAPDVAPAPMRDDD